MCQNVFDTPHGFILSKIPDSEGVRILLAVTLVGYGQFLAALGAAGG